MFDRTTDLYDLAYAHKDYAQESAWVRDAVRARVPEARTLLDVACGTGKHLEHLRNDFVCQGLDVEARFVEIAAERSNVPVHVADMDDFDLGERFDAVICLFSAIGYSRDLPAAIASMARHVSPGGVLVIEPWFTPDEWLPGHLHVLDHEADGVRLIRMSHSGIDGNVATMEMHHLVGTASGVEHLVDTHRMTLFTLDEYEAGFRRAGLSYELDHPGPFGRGALIGLPDS
ncbi:MAG: dTDP-3-amino-3,4,6-trideoxy-alpha-D-glucopyranose N,N-dimethyltransferase [Acidimicrobiaceae bacterium]